MVGFRAPVAVPRHALTGPEARIPSRLQSSGQALAPNAEVETHGQPLPRLLDAAAGAAGTIVALWAAGWPEQLVDAAPAALAGALGGLALWVPLAWGIDRRHARRRAALEARKRARVADRVADRRRQHARERSRAALGAARAEVVEAPAPVLVATAAGAGQDAGAPEATTGIEPV
jgi:hypothetical protein